MTYRLSLSVTRYVQKLSQSLYVCAVLAALFTATIPQTVFAETIVLAAADSTPTAYTENGKQSGILVDVINEAFKRADYPVEIKIMPWARCLKEVKDGNVDGIFSAYDIKERHAFLTYATEVLITQVQAFFVLKDSTITFDGDLTKLSDKSIGIIIQTSYGPRLDLALKNGTFVKVDQTTSAPLNVKKLLEGRVEIIPSYRHVVLSTAKSLGAVNQIKELSPEIEAIPSYLAFTKKRNFTNIIRDFNKALLSMKNDGTYDIIFNNYIK
ncbi:substrate-binding periplasmic protein [Desulfosediminicola flagellatus]|uniref:substrate-binding periplasmic protein n=1 Tax=Desulfosediminicola flagellatus TaxID=2569541 RepID=UPI0010ACD037|nr:transporter substrate-binding domain-containing protein [Desulfosediminicola flagellatus]